MEPYSAELEHWIEQAARMACDEEQARRASFAAREAYRADPAHALHTLGRPADWLARDAARERRAVGRSALVFCLLGLACFVYLALRAAALGPQGAAMDPAVYRNPNVMLEVYGADVGAAFGFGAVFLGLALVRGFQWHKLR